MTGAPMPSQVAFIVVAQLFGTSLWLSAKSADDDLIRGWGITAAFGLVGLYPFWLARPGAAK